MRLDSLSDLRERWNAHVLSAQQRATNLSLLCACLAVGDTTAIDLPERLTATTVDWQGLCWLAGCGLVTPSLAGALQRKGLFKQLPEEVQAYLLTLQSLNQARNQTLRDQLLIITEALNASGIQPVLLKGAITLTPGQYPGAEDRVIGDLDLLVPPHLLEAATSALMTLGYGVDATGAQWVLPSHYQRHHHERPLLHPILPVKVELHRRIQYHQGDNALLCQQLLTKPFSFEEGPTVLIPDRETRLLHNMLHGQITDRHRLKHIIDLRQLLEFAALAHHEASTLDAHYLLTRLRPQRHAVLADYWAQAEYWLQAPYPDILPRSSQQARQRWLLEKAATQPSWHRLFACLDWLSRVPGRLPNLLIKLWVMPGYLPAKMRAVLKG
jgi:hypothetical protein